MDWPEPLVCYYFGDMGNVVWHTSYKLSLFNYIDYNNPVAVALVVVVVVVVVVDVVVNVAVSPECVSQQIYFNTDHHHHCNHDHDHHYHHHYHHYHHYHHRQRHCHHSQYRAHNNITYDYI
ncbi:hypothetical protein GQX74_003430 [Glossina fuscipes]|nr:hypothetical protein GQX74_003430 [Glossina fuscipes]